MLNPRIHRFGRPAAVASLLLLALVQVAGGAAAQDEEDGYAPSIRQQLVEIDQALQISDGLPNEKARLYGLRAYLKGNYAAAARSFEKAARYADKYSQHRLSLLYWEGRGVARDLARSYVWSELAAERGTPNLVEIRRSMWAGLHAAERERAHALSADYFARFGDAKAKPRQIRAMKRFATVRTGSRAGFDDQRLTMTTVALGGGGMAADISRSVSPKSFYNDERANPKRYWRIQDALLKGGTVEVGDPVAGPEVLVPAPDAHSTESEPAASSPDEAQRNPG